MSIIILSILLQISAIISMLFSHKDLCPFGETVRECFYYWACLLSCVNVMILATQYDEIAAIALLRGI